MAVRVTPEQLAEKWGRRLKGATEDIRQGIARVDVAPGRRAAEQADKWQQRLSLPETKRKWAARVAAVSLEDWKSAILNKGLIRIAAGVDGAMPKMEKFAAALISYQNSGLTELERMPDLTLEDSISRQTWWTRYMAKFEFID